MKFFFLRFFWLFISFSIVILDFCSKSWMIKHCVIGKSVKLFFTIKGTLVINKGIAFGFFSYEGNWQKWIFSCISIFISILLINKEIKLRKDFFLKFSYAMIIGGILGNTLDRIIYGFVIDFIDINVKNYSYFPIFNIADLSIFIGMLIMMSFFLKKEKF